MKENDKNKDMLAYIQAAYFSGKNISLPASKSIANRLLILSALISKKKLEIFGWENLAADTQLMADCIDQIEEHRKHSKLNALHLNCQNAGTVFRFLTAYLAFGKGDFILDGSQRMKERPIKALVSALKQIGAQIRYLEKEGFPPLYIQSSTPTSSNLEVEANISSQYITALMLISPLFLQGLKIKIREDKPISAPYVLMTAKILTSLGFSVKYKDKEYTLCPSIKKERKTFFIEKDWSSASYIYAQAVLQDFSYFDIPGLCKDSLQGDAILHEWFVDFGLRTEFTPQGVRVFKEDILYPKVFLKDFSDYPDLAQTFAVLCALLNIKAELKGLQTLLYKETDRLEALYTQLSSLGFAVKIRNNKQEATLYIEPLPQELYQQITSRTETHQIDCYQDHRMFMAFSLLAAHLPFIRLEDPKVVEKSFPRFCEVLLELGIHLQY